MSCGGITNRIDGASNTAPHASRTLSNKHMHLLFTYTYIYTYYYNDRAFLRMTNKRLNKVYLWFQLRTHKHQLPSWPVGWSCLEARLVYRPNCIYSSCSTHSIINIYLHVRDVRHEVKLENIYRGAQTLIINSQQTLLYMWTNICHGQFPNYSFVIPVPESAPGNTIILYWRSLTRYY